MERVERSMGGLVIGANTGRLDELVRAQEEARKAKMGVWGP